MELEIASFMLESVGVEAESISDYDQQVGRLAISIRKRFGTPIYPAPAESLALSLMKPKTAALAFDKIYRVPILSDPVPEEIAFYCATREEMHFFAEVVLWLVAQDHGIELRLPKSEPATPAANLVRNIRRLCSGFQKELGIAPTILYDVLANRNKEFPVGSREVLTAAISNVAMVDEECLTWQQIMEFRKDPEASKKYRRIVRWIDTELIARLPEEVQDLVAIRLDDYEWALKKHGMKAAVGTLSALLDPKFLGATSATMAAIAVATGSFWAALAGACLTVGKATVAFGTATIDGLDERRKENYEVAYVHEVQKRLR